LLISYAEINVFKERNMSNFKVGSLFAGIGGIDLGFKNAGFQIEWANEIDIKSGKISHLSPIGSALMSKRVGDKVIAEVPIGKMELEILDIRVK
jgi:hypothetical protein